MSRTPRSNELLDGRIGEVDLGVRSVDGGLDVSEQVATSPYERVVGLDPSITTYECGISDGDRRGWRPSPAARFCGFPGIGPACDPSPRCPVDDWLPLWRGPEGDNQSSTSEHRQRARQFKPVGLARSLHGRKPVKALHGFRSTSHKPASCDRSGTAPIWRPPCLGIYRQMQDRGAVPKNHPPSPSGSQTPSS